MVAEDTATVVSALPVDEVGNRGDWGHGAQGGIHDWGMPAEPDDAGSHDDHRRAATVDADPPRDGTDLDVDEPVLGDLAVRFVAQRQEMCRLGQSVRAPT